MAAAKQNNRKLSKLPDIPGYSGLLSTVVDFLETARRESARSINTYMTASYWLIGRRIVEFEQRGGARASYGEALLKRLSADLTRRFGRGFSVDNLESMRLFYNAFPRNTISETMSRISRRQPEARKSEAVSRIFNSSDLATAFPLSWSHYVLLIRRSRSPEAMAFYETEAVRGGWSVRQLARQIDSQFYERTALSKNKTAMLVKGGKALPGEIISTGEVIKDPYILEFLGLKDEYSETDLEEALIHHLETFLLELGGDFCFVGRQQRLRIGTSWYRVDLVFFHRRLRSLVIVDLKIGEFSHADAGQMHLYLNYAREHWMRDGENPPVGLILCAEKNETVARYALEGLPNKVMAARYRTALPNERKLAQEIKRTQKLLKSGLRIS